MALEEVTDAALAAADAVEQQGAQAYIVVGAVAGMTGGSGRMVIVSAHSEQEALEVARRRYRIEPTHPETGLPTIVRQVTEALLKSVAEYRRALQDRTGG